MAKTSTQFVANYWLDSVGRRRKLSAGAMKSICAAYADGEKTSDLAAAYGVSTALIRTVTYHTARKADLAKIQGSQLRAVS